MKIAANPVCVESPGFTYVRQNGGLLFFELELATWKAATSRSTPDYTTNQRSHLLDSRLDFRSHANINLEVEFSYPEFHAKLISNDPIQSKLTRLGTQFFQPLKSSTIAFQPVIFSESSELILN